MYTYLLLIFAINLLGCYAADEKEDNYTKHTVDKIEFEEETDTNLVNRLVNAYKNESEKENGKMKITPIKTNKIDKRSAKTFKKFLNFDDTLFVGRIPKPSENGTTVYEDPDDAYIEKIQEENPNKDFFSVRLGCKKSPNEYRKIYRADNLAHLFGEHKMTGPSSKIVKLSGGSNQILDVTQSMLEQQQQELD